METQQLQGVAGLKKHDIKVSGIVFMLYCLVAAGAFGIEEMIPESGPGMTLLLLCIFPIIWALPISSLAAECSSVMPTLGGLASLPAGSWENWSTKGGFGVDNVGYATILTQNLGTAWGYVFLVIAIISQCAIFNTYLASGSRGFFVLADDHLCPQFLVKVSKNRGVPYVGILSLAIVTFILAQSDFKTLVSMEVVFMQALYIILPIAFIKLRRKLPIEERAKRDLYWIKGGNGVLVYFCGFPIAIALIALLVDGTDYLATGLMALCSGPVAYIIFRKTCGGLAVNDPEGNPSNGFGIAVGDTVRIGVFAICAGVLAFFGQFWLRWYEGPNYGDWEPSDYKVFQDCIPQVQNWLAIGGAICIILGIVLFFMGRRKDAPLPEKKLNVDEVLDKYLMEEKTETFFD